MATHTSVSPGLRLLSIPEILSIIVANDLQRTDLVRLAQSCRRAFSIVSPLVWQHVNGAGSLLGLIKSASLKYGAKEYNIWESEANRAAQLKQVALNQQSGSNQFERFDVYAPFIKSLKVYPDDREFFRISGWPLLLARARSRPLLPNLKKLSVVSEDSHIIIADVPLWIKALASNSLVEVSWCIENYYWPDDVWEFTHRTTCEILDHIVETSPNIQRVDLGPRQICDSFECDSPLSGSSDGPSLKLPGWCQRVHQLPFLRHVSVTKGWRSRSAMVALGKLETLESLELDVEDCNFYAADQIKAALPPGAFPALSRLSLRNLTLRYSKPIFRVSCLFERLTELEVSLVPADSEYEELLNAASMVEEDILPELSNTPRLNCLSVTGLGGGSPVAIKNPESLSTMLSVPLQNISICALTLGKAPFKVDLGVIWPNVTELVLPCQIASLQELAYFAAMPMLVRLVVRLNLTANITPTNIPAANHARLTTLESAKKGKLSSAPLALEHHARVLRLLWPLIRMVNWANSRSVDSSAALTLNRILAGDSVPTRADQEVAKAHRFPSRDALGETYAHGLLAWDSDEEDEESEMDNESEMDSESEMNEEIGVYDDY